ncbi:MAG: hypothetical protein ACRDD1_17495, partial [Planctomycetia bacterium]
LRIRGEEIRAEREIQLAVVAVAQTDATSQAASTAAFHQSFTTVLGIACLFILALSGLFLAAGQVDKLFEIIKLVVTAGLGYVAGFGHAAWKGRAKELEKATVSVDDGQ